jgi:hypothetical protein
MMKKRKIWVKKINSFEEENKADIKYYASETPEERLSDIQFCRQQYYLLRGKNENGKGLRRVVKIIKQTRGK